MDFPQLPQIKGLQVTLFANFKAYKPSSEELEGVWNSLG